jgi:hypothetical protein
MSDSENTIRDLVEKMFEREDVEGAMVELEEIRKELKEEVKDLSTDDIVDRVMTAMAQWFDEKTEEDDEEEEEE